MDLKEEQALGGAPQDHWYYISKGRAIKDLLGDGPMGEILDVGAGSGVFSRMLVDEGLAKSAVCVDTGYDDAYISKKSSRKISLTREIDATQADTILMIDVIEHVDDDVALIRDYAQKAQTGARVLISVPAFPFLWSQHDDFLEHRRRYTLKTLRRSVRAAGLEPVKMKYFFGALFPAAAAMRVAQRTLRKAEKATASQLKPAPDWLNKSLVAIHDLERAAFFPINRFAGVTAFCLAEKREAVAEKTAAA